MILEIIAYVEPRRVIIKEKLYTDVVAPIITRAEWAEVQIQKEKIFLSYISRKRRSEYRKY